MPGKRLKVSFGRVSNTRWSQQPWGGAGTLRAAVGYGLRQRKPPAAPSWTQVESCQGEHPLTRHPCAQCCMQTQVAKTPCEAGTGNEATSDPSAQGALQV